MHETFEKYIKRNKTPRTDDFAAAADEYILARRYMFAIKLSFRAFIRYHAKRLANYLTIAYISFRSTWVATCLTRHSVIHCRRPESLFPLLCKRPLISNRAKYCRESLVSGFCRVCREEEVRGPPLGRSIIHRKIRDEILLVILCAARCRKHSRIYRRIRACTRKFCTIRGNN